MAVLEYYTCPICARSIPLGYMRLPLVDPRDLGRIQTRECGGRAMGFRKIDDVPLSAVAEGHPKLVAGVADIVSGLYHMFREYGFLTWELGPDSGTIDDLQRQNFDLGSQVEKLTNELYISEEERQVLADANDDLKYDAE